jgi:ubiquinone biosynthesis protein UbiJ
MTAAPSQPSELVHGATASVPLAFLERVLNRLVAESTAAANLLEELQGSSFAIRVDGLGAVVVLHAEAERLRIGTDAAGATATLRATPIDLVRLMNADGVSGVKSTRAQISGDLGVAERFADLLRLARPDLEGELARFVGDMPAHALGGFALGVTGWFKRAAQALQMNTAEFLQEESRALPAALEAQAFYRDVERLRDDVERAAARLARLTRGV